MNDVSELIPFPEKEEQLLASGTRKLLAHDYLAAKKDFEKLYEQTNTFDYVQLLVESYRLLGDIERALYYAEEYQAEYLEQEQTVEKYLHLLLLDEQYLTVHRLLQQYPNEKVQRDLLLLESTQDLIGEQTYLVKESQLQLWDQQRLPILGNQWHQWLKRLSLTRFVSLARTYLVRSQNPFLSPKLIEMLLSCGVKETILVKTIANQEVDIDLSKLQPLAQTPQLQLLLKLIAEKWENDDPQMAEAIALEAQAHLALLYPVLPEITAIPDWAQSYHLEYRAMFGDEQATIQLEKYTEIQEIKQKLREIYQELF